MIFSDLEFHNVSELKDFPAGKLLQRFPQPVREHPATNDLARLVMTKSAGAEIRFFSTAPRIRIAITAMEKDAKVYAFRGDYIHSETTIPAGQTKWLLLETPAPLLHSYFTGERFENSRFSNGLWRIWCGRESLLFSGIDTFGSPLRPPLPHEKPATRWLAYGSSLTMGSNALFEPACYTEQTARLLGIDVLNLGMGGSCFLEPHLADFIAERNDWDFLTARLGCNMIGIFEPDEYRRRLLYFLQTISSAHPHRPLVIIGLSKNTLHFHSEQKIWQQHTAAYADINEALAKDFPSVHFWSASDLMPDHRLFSTDFIHPDDAGHSQIATHLASKLRSASILPPVS